MNKAIVLSAKNLYKTYHDSQQQITILDDFCLEVKQGEHLAIMGASGSGKTTLLQLLGGLDLPDSGKVIIKDQSLFTLSSRKLCALRNKYLGFVYQFHHLLPEFTALENVAMPGFIAGINKSIALTKAKKLLARVGLSKRVTHKPSTLSGGERQRVAIARALIQNPLVVLADEPTGNLDPKTAEEVYSLMREIHYDYQTSFIMVTHDINLANKMDRIIEL